MLPSVLSTINWKYRNGRKAWIHIRSRMRDNSRRVKLADGDLSLAADRIFASIIGFHLRHTAVVRLGSCLLDELTTAVRDGYRQARRCQKQYDCSGSQDDAMQQRHMAKLTMAITFSLQKVAQY